LNLSAQQTLETYIVVLAALCGGLATWLLSGWLLRWTGRSISRQRQQTDKSGTAQQAQKDATALTAQLPAAQKTVSEKSAGTPP